jgi:uracil-DNA glycosylase
VSTDGKTPSLEQLREQARHCTACPLYQHATQTVFGVGSASSHVMLIGETPGDREDIEGLPFVGPAGQLLDRALADAGIDRRDCYVTNAVKHFKWEPRGKRRLHKTPAQREIDACRRWLLGEIAALHPRLLICLGATAAQAIFGPSFRVTRSRGLLLDSPLGVHAIATVHPSAVLRSPTPEERERSYQALVADLVSARAALTSARRATRTPGAPRTRGAAR